jgi:hypothetical protein
MEEAIQAEGYMVSQQLPPDQNSRLMKANV